ncbi:hypothetical protein ACOJUR_11865 [Alicyclobacillus tolerans]|uniref:hypothetical protein n=1 Tax=Alicyclobacillus tolerans TaxID=90970 RepID=UPI003B7EEE87
MGTVDFIFLRRYDEVTLIIIVFYINDGMYQGWIGRLAKDESLRRIYGWWLY